MFRLFFVGVSWAFRGRFVIFRRCFVSVSFVFVCVSCVFVRVFRLCFV